MVDLNDDVARTEVFISAKEAAEMKGFMHARRRVFISGLLNEKTLRRATLEVVKLDFNSREPVTLIIDSAGGDVEASHQFFGIISTLNAPVDAVVIGECSSMAVDLVQVCRQRMILPSTRMLLHYIRMGRRWIADNPESLEGDIQYFRKEAREIREQRFALYERRTGRTREELEKMFRYGEMHGAYFSASQIIELGLADEIVTDFKLFPGRHQVSNSSA